MIIISRDWRSYSKDILNAKLSSTEWNIDIDDVQNYWNAFENRLINIVDEIVPLAAFSGKVIK